MAGRHKVASLLGDLASLGVPELLGVTLIDPELVLALGNPGLRVQQMALLPRSGTLVPPTPAPFVEMPISGFYLLSTVELSSEPINRMICWAASVGGDDEMDACASRTLTFGAKVFMPVFDDNVAAKTQTKLSRSYLQVRMPA